jgi:predicted nucleic acid-binding protein
MKNARLKKGNHRVFIDVNVLFEDFLSRNPQFGTSTQMKNRKYAEDAIKYLRTKKIETYIASFSIPILATLLDKIKVPRAVAIQEIAHICSRNKVSPLTIPLILSGLQESQADYRIKDLEDVFQYIACKNSNCYYLLTFNTKDFKHFLHIDAINPTNYRLMGY